MTSAHTEETASPSALFLQLGEKIEALLGLHFPVARLGDLERGISEAAHEFGFDIVDRFVEWLLSSTLSQNQIKTLAGYLTIGETYFFRNKRVFEILETNIVPGILKAKKGGEQQLKIWSAGCATGEEPFSLAIMLAGMLLDREDWNISILATDISPLCLKKAVRGVYGEWSFRETPKWVKDKWFTFRDRSYEVAQLIKEMVTFSSLNLADDCYPAI
ncbi:MAG: chemotaxis protein CheR, partial [Proteobacteria bacterium]|nr:chemotaxis protein CheR [Pseudomonadota bacterium]